MKPTSLHVLRLIGLHLCTGVWDGSGDDDDDVDVATIVAGDGDRVGPWIDSVEGKAMPLLLSMVDGSSGPKHRSPTFLSGNSVQFKKVGHSSPGDLTNSGSQR